MTHDTYSGNPIGDCFDCNGSGYNHGYQGNGSCANCYGTGRVTGPTYREALDRHTDRMRAMMGAPTPAPIGGYDEDEELVAERDELAYLIAVMWHRAGATSQQRWYEEMDDMTPQALVLQRVLTAAGLIDPTELAR